MRKLRKALLLMSAGIIALHSAVLPVQAGVVDDDTPTGYAYRLSSDTRSTHKELMYHVYNGRPAYCIEPWSIVADGDVYEEEAVEAWTGASAYDRETILLASVFGEGFNGREGKLWYAAAQDIIWHETGADVEWGDQNTEVKNAAAEIRSTIAEYRAVPDFHFLDTEENRETGTSGSAASLPDGVIGRMYQVTDRAGLVSAMHTGKAEGLHVFNENRAEIQASDISSNTFYIRNDEPHSEGTVSFGGFSGNFRFTGIPIILYGNRKAPHAQKHIVTGSVAPRDYSIKMTASETPFNPRKTDEKGNGMKGAVLSLEKDGTVVDTWTSDGKEHPMRLRMGEKYVLKEKDAPDGYYCRDFSFEVPERNNAGVVTDFANDQKIRYEVMKSDENHYPVKGARLALYDVTDGMAKLVKMDDKQGNPWITTVRPRDISAYLHVNHTYSIVEEDVSTKYFLAEDTTFTVAKNAPEGNPMITETITDNHILYRFAKIDEKGNPVENAELKIFDLDDHNREVYHFTTGLTPTVTGLLERGHRYRLVETRTPDGKYTMWEKRFRVPQIHGADPITITGMDCTIVFCAEKLDENNQPVAGASMEVHDVTDGADRLVQSFVTNGEPQLLEGMIAGHDYILHEVSGPDGYYLSEDVPFMVPVHGSDDPVYVTAVDHSIHLPVRKTDTDGHPLADITLEVFDKESGSSIGSWKTKPDTDIEIGPLVHAGREYILRETESVNGYYLHEDMTFQVPEYFDEERKISITMQDEPIRIQVLKKDESGNTLEGAHITLSEKDSDTVLHEWDTVTEPHDISAYVYPGKTYVLRETEIVNGHYQAVDQEFTVDQVPQKDNPQITLEMIDETVRYEIAKVDEKGKPVSGVHLRITDPETQTVVDEWDTDEKVHALTGVLSAGHTYVLEETEWVNGVVRAQDMQFTVPLKGSSSEAVRIEMVDETLDLAFLKTDSAGKPLAGAELSVLDQNGAEICSFKSTDDPHGVSETKNGVPLSSLLKGGETYVLHEKKAPSGYEKAEDIRFIASGTLARPQLISMTDRPCDVYIQVIKMDAGNPEKKLAGAEITVYRKSDHHIARDITGKAVVLKTDQNGRAATELPYDPDGYDVRETKAPSGYQLNSQIHEVRVSDEKGFSEEKPAVIQILDDQEVDTGAAMNWKIGAGAGFMVLAVVLAVFSHRRTI